MLAGTGSVLDPNPTAPPPPAMASPIMWAPCKVDNVSNTVLSSNLSDGTHLGVADEDNLLVRARICLVVKKCLHSGCSCRGATRIVCQSCWIDWRICRDRLRALGLDLRDQGTDYSSTRRFGRCTGSNDMYSCAGADRCSGRGWNGANREERSSEDEEGREHGLAATEVSFESEMCPSSLLSFYKFWFQHKVAKDNDRTWRM
jgi:hypothetical protein